jgi:hypothetical protein
MIHARAAEIATKIGNHTFRVTGVTAYLKNGGTLERAVQMANHASTRTTQLYDRRAEEVTLDEVERIAGDAVREAICCAPPRPTPMSLRQRFQDWQARSYLHAWEGAVIPWESCGGWMAFHYLTKGYGVLTRSFTLGYRITDNASDVWSQRFNRFKNKDMSALYGGTNLMSGAVPELVQALGIDIGDTVFVTALSSGETTANEKRALPIITKRCASKAGATFSLDALSKDVHRSIHDFWNENQRDEELEKANYKSTKLGKKNIYSMIL